MNIEIIREYCLMKKGVTEEFPFDESTLVFKVVNKIFLITDLEDRPLKLSLKCNPVLALELRERYDEVQPGYHLNKKHWNTVTVDSTLPDRIILEWVDHSYDMVVKGLSKAEQEKLKT